MRVVAESDKAETPDSAAAELALELHSVVAPEYAVAVEPALHELAFVSEKKIQYLSQSLTSKFAYFAPSAKVITPNPEHSPLRKEPSYRVPSSRRRR